MNRAFLIFGPESSGTRMLTEYLIRCTNAFGDWTHSQCLDRAENFNHLKPDSDIVWRRSLPHSGIWADIPTMSRFVATKGFTSIAIGIIRASTPTIASQLKNKHINTIERGQDNYNRAVEHINDFCNPVIYYEAFVNSYDVRYNFLKFLNIDPPEVEPMQINYELPIP